MEICRQHTLVSIATDLVESIEQFLAQVSQQRSTDRAVVVSVVLSIFIFILYGLFILTYC